MLVNINAELPMCDNITISETYLDSILVLGYQCITIDSFYQPLYKDKNKHACEVAICFW